MPDKMRLIENISSVDSLSWRISQMSSMTSFFLNWTIEKFWVSFKDIWNIKSRPQRIPSNFPLRHQAITCSYDDLLTIALSKNSSTGSNIFFNKIIFIKGNTFQNILLWSVWNALILSNMISFTVICCANVREFVHMNLWVIRCFSDILKTWRCSPNTKFKFGKVQ